VIVDFTIFDSLVIVDYRLLIRLALSDGNR